MLSRVEEFHGPTTASLQGFLANSHMDGSVAYFCGLLER